MLFSFNQWALSLVGAGLLLGFGSHATPGGLSSKICVPQVSKKVDELTSSLKKRGFYIRDITSLMIDSNRKAIREYYQLGQDCPSQEIVKQISDDLIAFGYPLEYLPGLFGKSLSEVGLRLYQIGDAWNREPLESLSELSENENRIYSSTVIGGLIREVDHSDHPKLSLYSVGTGFLLRTKMKNRFIVATALHVLEDNAEKLSPQKACQEMAWHFPSGDKVYFHGKELLLKSKSLDFALCELNVPEKYHRFMSERELELEEELLPKDTSLITIGFGVFGNDRPGRAYIERSPDCRNFLPGTEATIKAGRWSLPTGCDASPADSGSAVLNSKTGRVAGVLWGTTMVKRIISSEELMELSQKRSKHEILWSELSLMVPSSKIVQELKALDLL